MEFVNLAKEILEVSMRYKNVCDYNAVKKAIDNGEISRGLSDECFSLHTFSQLWGNTSGGFEGFGGSAMTTQNTIVLVPKFTHDALVFFGGTFAYRTPVTKEFLEDLSNKTIAGVHSRHKRYEKL